MNRFSRPLWLAALLLCTAFAHAERTDRDKPTTVESDQLFYDDLQQINIFKGNVVLTRGTLTIHADQLSTSQDAQGYQAGTALGNPAVLRQKSDQKNAAGSDIYTQASGSQVEYDGRTQRVRITGNATLKKFEGANVMEDVRGHVIIYDASNETYSVESGKGAVTPNNPKGRVRVVIQPKERSESAPRTPGSRIKMTFDPILKFSEEIRNPRPE